MRLIVQKFQCKKGWTKSNRCYDISIIHFAQLFKLPQSALRSCKVANMQQPTNLVTCLQSNFVKLKMVIGTLTQIENESSQICISSEISIATMRAISLTQYSIAVIDTLQKKNKFKKAYAFAKIPKELIHLKYFWHFLCEMIFNVHAVVVL